MKALIALVLVCLAAPAMADDAADVNALAQTFVRAWDAGNVKAALALYADDARVVWPGQGDEANGKAAIEALLTRTFQMFPKSGLVSKSQTPMALGNGYILNMGLWDQTIPGPGGQSATVRVRTTELLKRQGGKLVYVVDHASIGLTAPPSAASAPAASATAGQPAH